MKKSAWLACCIVSLALSDISKAQEQADSTPETQPHHEPAKGSHGGVLQAVGTQQVETVISEKGIMFVILGADGEVVKAPNAAGRMSLGVGDSSKRYDYKLQALKNHGVGAAIDLSKVVGHALHLDVELTGVTSSPMKFQVTGTLERQLSDTMLISLQKTCPVTGQPLGSMGAPPKLIVKGKPLFVCCAGCSGKVNANPDAYLSKYYGAAGKEIRPGVFEATLADAEAIAAQKKCPVMDEELGGMGVPQKVNVRGTAVFICCAGCAKKLDAEPQKYLAMLSGQGVNPPDFK